MTGPIVRLVFSLRRQLKDARETNTRLRLAVAQKEATLAVVSQELEQTRRDSELLALMAPDRKTALAIIRDAHTIQRLDEMS